MVWQRACLHTMTDGAVLVASSIVATGCLVAGVMWHLAGHGHGWTISVPEQDLTFGRACSEVQALRQENRELRRQLGR